MRMILLRAAAALAAVTMLVGCDEPTRPLAAGAPRASAADGTGLDSRIAYVAKEWQCGSMGETICDGIWGWVLITHIATIGGDGSNPMDVTIPAEGIVPSNPAWSPDGMRIAFEQGGEILVVPGAGGTPVNLTKHAANDAHPAWSPDGARIAFGSDRSGSPELYVMSAADGSGVTRLTTGVGFAGHADWSPDGTRIAFDCTASAGDLDVCAVNADGSGFVRLTSSPGYDGSADWSSTGRIAFATGRFGGFELLTMDGDGSNVVRVAPGVQGYDPDWTPDGSRLAFTIGDDIYTMSADGSNVVLLVAAGGAAAWRPTSTSLPPVAPPVVRLAAPVCVELTCTFDGSQSTDDAGTKQLGYQWSFGDGTVRWDTATPTHSFALGTYTVTLTVWSLATRMQSSTTQTVNVTGLPVGAPPVARFWLSCVGLTCTFDGRGSTDDAAIASYQWDLGQTTGGTATGPVVTTTYPTQGTRTVTLTVADGAGQTNSTSQTFDAMPMPDDAPPVAVLNVSCSGLLCGYDATASSDDKLILSYFIDIGVPGADVVRSSYGAISYAPGTYTITLTVVDGVGQASSASKTVTVSSTPPPDEPPTAAFAVSCVRTKCTFDGRVSTDDVGIDSYAWNLGSTSCSGASGAVVSCDYRRSGSYTVTLTVRDTAGQVGSVARTITVSK